jgi:sugar/nucleoside kinase (ribokinase family)
LTLSPHDLVVIGDCNPDVLVLGDDVTPAFGQQEKLVGSISLVIGGSAAIAAVAAARLGLSVALVAAVGADPLPEAAALGCAVGALSTGAPGGTASSPDMAVAAKLASVTSVA